MILVRLIGGLGNQLFQYATGKALALRRNTVLKIDTTLLEANKKNPHEINTHRDLDLGLFNVELVQATAQEIAYFNGKEYPHLIGKALNRLVMAVRRKNLVIEKGRGFNERVVGLGDNKCLVGAWQSEKYFADKKDEIRSLFKFRNDVPLHSRPLLDDISRSRAVCVNIRRGDYITSPLYRAAIGALDFPYYQEGMKYFRQKFADARFFIFSDDVEWCRSSFPSDPSFVIVGHEHKGEKFGNYLRLMSSCRHFVISNSSFAWWGAYLGEKKDSVVIAPGKWTRSRDAEPADIVPERWLKLSNGFEPL
jgi:hypothetical protein